MYYDQSEIANSATPSRSTSHRPRPRVIHVMGLLSTASSSNEQVVVAPPRSSPSRPPQNPDGFDFIRIYNGLSREAFYAIAGMRRAGSAIRWSTRPEFAVTTSSPAAAGKRRSTP